MINKYSPGAITQFYLTWGRKQGDSGDCPQIPEVCTYEGAQKQITDSYRSMACIFKDIMPTQVAPVGMYPCCFNNFYFNCSFF